MRPGKKTYFTILGGALVLSMVVFALKTPSTSRWERKHVPGDETELLSVLPNTSLLADQAVRGHLAKIVAQLREGSIDLEEAKADLQSWVDAYLSGELTEERAEDSITVGEEGGVRATRVDTLPNGAIRRITDLGAQK